MATSTSPTRPSRPATTPITIKTVGIDGGTSGGNITVANALAWSGGNSLTLSARHNIVFEDGRSLSNGDGAAITLAGNNEGRGLGTVQFGGGASVWTSGPVTIFYTPPGNDRQSVNGSSFTTPTDFRSNIGGGGSLTAYMLVNTVYDLQNIENNISGSYALGRNVDAFRAGWRGRCMGVCWHQLRYN